MKFIQAWRVELEEQDGSLVELPGYIQAAFAYHPVLIQLSPEERAVLAKVVGDRYDTLTGKAA